MSSTTTATALVRPVGDPILDRLNTHPSARISHRLLLVACLAFAGAGLLAVPASLPLGWDELVYASRFPNFGPVTEFSAPRTRGVPALVAPVAVFTGSVPILRTYLAAAAGLALYLGFRPWLRVSTQPYTVPLAAAFYGTGWIALFYAGSAMPNHYVATGAVGAVGAVLQLVGRRTATAPGARRRAVAGLVCALAVATVMRPQDGAAVAVPLLLAVLLMPGRRAAAGWGVVGGTVLGLLPWVVEAQLAYGGVLERLRTSAEIQGGMGWTFSVPEHAASLGGPLLCRPCRVEEVFGWPALSWWAVLLVLVAVGAGRMRRAQGQALALLLLTALSVSATYLFLVGYAAPRFLLPAYALLALPAAVGLSACAASLRRARPGPRRSGTVLGVVLLAAHLAQQGADLHTNVGRQVASRAEWRTIASVLHAEGVRPPCTIDGNIGAIPLAHTAGCRARLGAPKRPDALVIRYAHPPRWAADWKVIPVRGTYNTGWKVVVPGG